MSIQGEKFHLTPAMAQGRILWSALKVVSQKESYTILICQDNPARGDLFAVKIALPVRFTTPSQPPRHHRQSTSGVLFEMVIQILNRAFETMYKHKVEAYGNYEPLPEDLAGTISTWNTMISRAKPSSRTPSMSKLGGSRNLKSNVNISFAR
jgi:hypothetical protein